MIYQVKSYIKFLFKSSNAHGVHSPFVYNLVSRCFYDKVKYPEYATLNAYRSKLQSDHEEIEVIDFGAGSRVFKSDKRKVSAIANNAGITIKRQKLLFRLVHHFKPNSILELGTSLGLATSSLALGNPSAKIKTVEGCPSTAAKAIEYFDEFKLKNIQVNIKKFDDFLTENACSSASQLRPSGYEGRKASGGTRTETYDFCYIDGDHSKEKTLLYFNLLLTQISNNSVLVFDDIYWSSEMTEAWQEIIQHPKVTVSIDTFHWGIVFFRSEQQKEHFHIRL